MTRDFWTEDRLHIRTDRADWARYQAAKSGEGFRMPHMPKRKWRRTTPVTAAPAPVDPVAELRAEMTAFRKEVRMQGEKTVASIAIVGGGLGVLIFLAAAAVIAFGGAA